MKKQISDHISNLSLVAGMANQRKNKFVHSDEREKPKDSS